MFQFIALTEQTEWGRQQLVSRHQLKLHTTRIVCVGKAECLKPQVLFNLKAGWKATHRSGEQHFAMHCQTFKWPADCKTLFINKKTVTTLVEGAYAPSILMERGRSDVPLVCEPLCWRDFVSSTRQMFCRWVAVYCGALCHTLNRVLDTAQHC